MLENEDKICKTITTLEQAMDRMIENENGYTHAFLPPYLSVGTV